MYIRYSNHFCRLMTLQVSPDTMRRLGSMNLISYIHGTRTNELRSMNSCTLVSVGGECSFSGAVLSLFKL